MLYREKAEQAQSLMRALGLDCWLTFARETSERRDPGIDLVVGTSLTWNSAFLLGAGDERIAIVGRYDAPNVRQIGVFPEVISYDAGLREPLLAALERLNPRRIGLNYSRDDHTADGLTHGMFLLLQDLLAGTPFAGRLESAEPLVSRLRAVKTPAELDRIRAAIAVTEQIFAEIEPHIRPGISEAGLAERIHQQVRAHGLPRTAWDWDYCPTVNFGARSPLGHVRPQPDIVLQPGDLVHIDFGVCREDYCSDIQRMWYLARPGEQAPPDDIQRAFDACLAAIDAGAAVLRPGVPGWEVDAAARRTLLAAGYPEYMHALGHSLGRACHDGGPLLGPRWERYGASPMQLVEVQHVYTLELGVATAAGYIGLEDDVVVTADGPRYLSGPQRSLKVIVP